MRVITIIQARMGSTRLPGKVLLPIGGKPDIAWVTDRVSHCRDMDMVLLATTVSPEDDALAEWAHKSGTECFRGDVNDVLGRYYRAGLHAGAGPEDIIVRVTGDCPFIDRDVCSGVIARLKNTGADYACNVNPPTFPDGLDCEAMRFSALRRSYEEARLSYEREHVTQYILRHPEIFKTSNYANGTDLSHMRWTLDEPEDYKFLCAVADRLKRDDFAMADVLELLRDNPDITAVNTRFARNEGLQKSIREEPS